MNTPPRPDDLPEIAPGPPLLLVLSGFSGAGKDSVRDLLMAWRLPVHFAVTANTRPPRDGEVEGRDYRFVSDAEFDRLERDGELIEHAIVYGQRKGVPRDEVLAPLETGRDVLARVDVQGAFTLRQLVPDAVLIFIAPPSLEEAQRRLASRHTDTDEEQRLRVATAAAEMEASKSFDYIVVNETNGLDRAARRVFEIMADEKKRRGAT
ncbi:MAG TPA: guanylate kinase [Dehalococcoidia bacterium]|nr:guanylate kinase [Dehalococcoidia bacterium]